MKQHQFQDLTIQIFNDSTFSFGSADNRHHYLKHYFGRDLQGYIASKLGIKIFDEDNEINSCIIMGSGGATGVHENSSLLDYDRLLVCCCDSVFCLTLPDLNLLWQTHADTATCLQVFKFENDYLVHGELEISRIDKNGNIKWQFSGADIFVSFEGAEEFILNPDHILLKDFSGRQYKIDFDGQELRSGSASTQNGR